MTSEPGIELLAFGCGLFQGPRSFFLANDAVDTVRVPVPAWLIRHPTRGLAIFDTGLDERFRMDAEAELAGDAIGFDLRAGQDIAARLTAAGIDPAGVRWVINSHLHADHCGGNAAFPNATVVIQKREWEAACRNEDGRSYDARDFDHGQPRLEIEGEHDLFGDGTLVLFPTYGHTPGHQSARVRLEGGDIVLTADCCYWEQGLAEMAVPGINFDVESSREVLHRLLDMRARGDTILFGHDPVQWEKLPKASPIRL